MLQTDLTPHSDGSGVPRDAREGGTESLRTGLFAPEVEDFSVLDAHWHSLQANKQSGTSIPSDK